MEQQLLLWSRRDKYWSGGQVFLQVLQRSLRFRSPFHWTCLFQDFEKRQGAFRRPGDKPAKSRHATGKSSHILDTRWCFNLLDGLDLVGVGFDPTLGHEEPEKPAGGDSEHALLGVELEADLAQVRKGLFQVLDQVRPVFALDHYIIHVGLHISVDLWLKSSVDNPRKRRTCVLQSKWHPHKTVRAAWSDERSLLFIFFGHENLVVPGVGVKKRKQVTSGRGVNNLVNAQQGKRIFGASLVNIGEVDAKPPFPICFAHDDRIGQPRRMEYASDEACHFQLPDLLRDELLALHRLLPDFLLDGPRMRTDGKVVLNHFPRNAGDVRWLPGKHIDIRPQKSDERAFLFGVESGVDGEGTTSAVLLGGHLLGRWWSSRRLLAFTNGARWCVLNGGATLQRGALAGVGTRAFAGLGLLAGGARWHVLDGSAALRRGALAGVGARAFTGLGLHAGGARWHVLDGSAALRRGALAGVGARALAGH